jgi:cytochrome c-type biogenesis protein CcmH
MQMVVTLPGWVLIISSIAIAALLFVKLRIGGLRRLSWMLSPDPRGGGGIARVGAGVFLLVAGVGAITSFIQQAPATGSDPVTSASSRPAQGGDSLARLGDYVRSAAASQAADVPAAGNLLPDVNSMIERLAARLETTPDDVNGWRMLGWSYFNTGQHELAASAYARAVELDPKSADLKRAYEEARAKSSGLRVAAKTEPKPAASAEGNAAIRAMVDGLATRLEQSPRDLEGWARLMRSRVVLGEKEIAATAFRKALTVFKDDAAATGKLNAAALELGLKTE